MTIKTTKKIWSVSVFFTMLTVCLLCFSGMGYASGGEDAEYSININVSSNIINLDSERWGDIRIYTSVRYSLYATSGHSIFVYFNDSESVENVRPTRDSLGNLILRFTLEELLILEDSLKPNEYNHVKVVVSMDNGDEYIGEGDVYLNKKK